MKQHIIDTDELEKLQKFVMLDMTNGVEQCTHGDYVHIDDFRKLIANSPQADESYGQDFNLEYTCKRIRRLLNVIGMSDPSNGKDHVLMGMLFTLLGTICSKLEKPQADDVRKDLEREWVPKFPVGSKVVFYQKHPESPLDKEPTFGTVESYYDWNTAECGEHYTIKMAVVDVDGIKIKVEHNCLLAIDKAME